MNVEFTYRKVKFAHTPNGVYVEGRGVRTEGPSGLRWDQSSFAPPALEEGWLRSKTAGHVGGSPPTAPKGAIVSWSSQFGRNPFTGGGGTWKTYWVEPAPVMDAPPVRGVVYHVYSGGKISSACSREQAEAAAEAGHRVVGVYV